MAGSIRRRVFMGMAAMAISAGLSTADVQAQAPRPPTTEEGQALAAASQAFSQAYMVGDTTTIRNLYTEDGMLLPPGRTVTGRDAIVRYFAPGPRRENTHHAMVSDKLTVTGRTAVDVGTWYNRWRMDGGEEQSAEGTYLVVWTQGADGRWRIQYDAWHRPTS